MAVSRHSVVMDPVFESNLRAVIACVLLSVVLSQIYVFASPVGISSPWIKVSWLTAQYVSRISRKMFTSTVDLAKSLYTIWYSFRAIIRDFVRPKALKCAQHASLTM